MQQINGEININLSSVDHCEEKEAIFTFKTQQTTQKDFLSNAIPLWESIQKKLAIAIPTLDDDNEWFDEYSINIHHENANLSSQKTPETELDCRRIQLIKNANDFSRYFERCTMRVLLIIKVESLFRARIYRIKQTKISKLKNKIYNNNKNTEFLFTANMLE